MIRLVTLKFSEEVYTEFRGIVGDDYWDKFMVDNRCGHENTNPCEIDHVCLFYRTCLDCGETGNL